MRVRPFVSSCQKFRPSLVLSFFLYLILAHGAFAQMDCDPGVNICLKIMTTEQEALIGVNVVIDEKYYASSDAEGRCQIPVTYRSDTASISFVGFKTQRIPLERLTRRLNIITMKSDLNDLGEVVVIGRREVSRDNIAQKVELLSRPQIDRVHPSSSTDILEKSGVLFVQKSQLGGGSPVIRGFEANRILLVVDNVRMNNAIYRAGHLQNAITVDPYLLKRTEVQLGPSSLLYGSDALGGVVHFVSKDAGIDVSQTDARSELSYGLSYGSAANERGVHVDFNMGRAKLGILTSLSYVDFDDLKAGKRYSRDFPEFGRRAFFADRRMGRDTIIGNDRDHVQIGTAYHQLDLTQKFRYLYSDDWTFGANFQFSNSSDIPRYDALTEPGTADRSLRWADWYYGPQRRSLTSLNADWHRAQRYWDNARFILSNQLITEERNTRRFDSDILTRNQERVRVWSATADFEKQLDTILLGSLLRYGADLQFNRVKSQVREINITDSTRMTPGQGLTRYPSEKANLSSFSVYGMAENKFLEEKLRVQAGLRLGVESIAVAYRAHPTIEWPTEYLEGVTRTVGVITANAGAKYRMDDQRTLRATLGTAYRNPNIDDQGKIRIRNQQILIPNLTLKPERSVSLEIGGEQKLSLPYPFGASRIQLDLFYTLVHNEIVRQAMPLPSGDTVIISEGESLQTIAQVNANTGRIRGWFLGFDTELIDRLDLSIRFNATRGVSTLEDGSRQAAAHIPPFFGLVELGTSSERDWDARLALRFNGSKRAERFAPNSSDNLEFATADGSLGWMTWNLYFDYDLSRKLSVSAGLENIFDLHYRTFSSGVSAPGRNFSLRLRGTL